MLVATRERDWSKLGRLVLAALPALAITVAWTLFYAPVLLALSTPNRWVLPPDLGKLIQAVAGTVLLVPLLGVALFCAAIRCRARSGFVSGCRTARPDHEVLFGSMAAYALLTLAGWIGSHLVTPFFVVRYFIPNMSIEAMLIVAGVGAIRHRVRPALSATLVAVGILAGVGGLVFSADASFADIPCLDGNGRFLEEAAAAEGLPVIAETPQVWLPRDHYATRQSTLYPLDWQVVVNHPYGGRNDAVDYHIMEALRDWAGPGTDLGDRILDTATLAARYDRFLVLDEEGRGWLENLRRNGSLSASVVAEHRGCKLWRIER